MQAAVGQLPAVLSIMIAAQRYRCLCAHLTACGRFGAYTARPLDPRKWLRRRCSRRSAKASEPVKAVQVHRPVRKHAAFKYREGRT
jgi:hypothetical protein